MYNTDGYLAYTDYYRVFRDEEWPEQEDHINEENQTDADNQIDLPLLGDQEDIEEQEESDALITSLVYTSVNDDAAELSEDCDIVDDGHGTGKEGSLTTANDHDIDLPGVPPATNLRDASNPADNDVHQQAQKDPN